jgi:hypothetical protein
MSWNRTSWARSSFASLRLQVTEIVEMALTQAGAAMRRDLLDALADAVITMLGRDQD